MAKHTLYYYIFANTIGYVLSKISECSAYSIVYRARKPLCIARRLHMQNAPAHICGRAILFCFSGAEVVILALFGAHVVYHIQHYAEQRSRGRG